MDRMRSQLARSKRDQKREACFQIHSLRRAVFRGVHRRAATAVHSAGSGDSGTVFHGASRGIVREQPDPEGLAGIREERGSGRVGGRYAAAGVRRYTLAGDSILRMTSKR